VTEPSIFELLRGWEADVTAFRETQLEPRRGGASGAERAELDEMAGVCGEILAELRFSREAWGRVVALGERLSEWAKGLGDG
jgi:hypothetical protein